MRARETRLYDSDKDRHKPLMCGKDRNFSFYRPTIIIKNISYLAISKLRLNYKIDEEISFLLNNNLFSLHYILF